MYWYLEVEYLQYILLICISIQHVFFMFMKLVKVKYKTKLSGLMHRQVSFSQAVFK